MKKGFGPKKKGRNKRSSDMARKTEEQHSSEQQAYGE